MDLPTPDYLLHIQYGNPDNLNARILIHRLFSTGTQEWHDFIFNHLAITAHMRVLAMGAGNANQWRANRKRFPETASIILSDFSVGMLREARLADQEHPVLKLACLDAQAAPFADKCFDLVTANHMLYHVPVPSYAIREAARLIKPGGRFMAVTNGETHMQELDMLLHEFSPSYQRESSMHSSFSLENGEAQLRPCFGAVEQVMFDSDLWVTDAALLSAYAYSTPAVKETFDPQSFDTLTAFFQEKIEKEGGIFIRKRTGMFLATGPLV